MFNPLLTDEILDLKAAYIVDKQSQIEGSRRIRKVMVRQQLEIIRMEYETLIDKYRTALAYEGCVMTRDSDAGYKMPWEEEDANGTV